MKNQKTLRTFEAISLALIIVEILNQTSLLFFISYNQSLSKGSDLLNISFIVTIITALFPVIILYLIYDYSRKNCNERYSPGMTMLIAGSIVLVMSVRGFAKYPEGIYDILKMLLMMPDHRMTMSGIIYNGIAMASSILGIMIAIMLLRRGYNLVHGTIGTDPFFKTSEVRQIIFPVSFGVLVLTMFEKGESLASIFIPKLIYHIPLVGADLYWMITDIVLSMLLVYGIYRYCKGSAVQKDVRREAYLIAGGILLIHELRNVIYFVVMPWTLITDMLNYSGKEIELSIIAINTISLLFFILKLTMSIWYLRNRHQDNTGDPLMP